MAATSHHLKQTSYGDLQSMIGISNKDGAGVEMATINQDIGEASIMNGDDLEDIQMAADTERSAVKVSMIRKNKEILFQDG